MFEIRDAKICDAAAIAHVHVETWRSTYRGIVPDEYLAGLSVDKRRAFWEQIIQSLPTAQHLLVAVDESSRVLGFSNGGPNRDPNLPYAGEVLAIYLLQEYQGRGIGRSLFQASVDRLVQSGFSNMVLWVLADNPACQFYASMGGQVVAEKWESIDGKMLRELAYGWDVLQPFVTVPIYHIADEALWLQAQATGEYRHSSLSTEGFIHCSKLEQVLPVAQRYFAGQTGLLLLEITVAKLQAGLRYENTTGGTELFPHVYGSINYDAIHAVHRLEIGSDGLSTLPRHLKVRD